LFVALPLEESAARMSIDLKNAGELLDSARRKLFAHREARVRPGRDDKILTSWNALMIRGMAIAGRVLEREDFIVAALQALAFLRTEVYRDGKLLATWKEGRARFPAYLDDYAFLLDATLELLQSHWDKSMLEFAIALADDLLARFEDKAGGGFFFTAHDHEALIHRPKSMMDESMPAGNGVAAFALNRLGYLLGYQHYSLAAERTLQASMPGMSGYPQAYGSMLNALDEWSSPPQTIVIRGTIDEMGDWRHLALERYAPNRLCLAIPAEESGLPGLLEERKPGTEITAYVCEARACLPPARSREEFQRLLNA
jgi:uncharacterized protein YyaL (SSP411 family)